MQINELIQLPKKVTTFVRAQAMLSAYGFSAFGSGSYSVVYNHNNLDYVLKIFRNDSCYLHFVKLAKQMSHNLHFPKFRGNVIKIYGNIYAVRMEKLQPLLYKDDQEYQYDYLAASDEKSERFSFDNIKSKYPQIIEARTALNDHLGGSHCEFDIHMDNMMQRADGTVVVIDPYYDYYELQAVRKLKNQSGS